MEKIIKRNIVIVAVALVVGLSIYRISAMVREGDRQVHNIVRIHAESGIPVKTIELQISDDALKFPLSVKNSRAFVPYDIKLRLKKGMMVGKQKIISISDKLDFDTGLYEVRISGKVNGEFFASSQTNGIFIPRSAISNNSVWINSDGHAVQRKIKIAASDADNAIVSSGVKKGELLIISSTANLTDGVKVK